MKKFCLLILLFTLAVGMHAQNAAQARKILDKTAAVVGRKSGASANFTISGKYGNIVEAAYYATGKDAAETLLHSGV